jgi:conjugal transfer pilus assembly protein TraE
MQVDFKKLRLQRNLLIGALGIMVVSNSLLAVKLYNQDIVTRLLPTIESEQIISSSFASDSALKSRAEQILYLLFSMKPENVEQVSAALLKQVDNSTYDEFKKQINVLAEDIRTKNYRYVFDITAYEFDNHNYTVKVKGSLETYLSGKLLETKAREYLISFFNRGGVLTLNNLEVANAPK